MFSSTFIKDRKSETMLQYIGRALRLAFTAS